MMKEKNYDELLLHYVQASKEQDMREAEALRLKKYNSLDEEERAKYDHYHACLANIVAYKDDAQEVLVAKMREKHVAKLTLGRYQVEIGLDEKEDTESKIQNDDNVDPELKEIFEEFIAHNKALIDYMEMLWFARVKIGDKYYEICKSNDGEKYIDIISAEEVEAIQKLDFQKIREEARALNPDYKPKEVKDFSKMSIAELTEELEQVNKYMESLIAKAKG